MQHRQVLYYFLVIVSQWTWTRGAIPGADPTGVKDSSAALNTAIRSMCSASCVDIGPDGVVSCASTNAMAIAPRDAVLDLENGVYRLTAPIAINGTLACTGMLRITHGTLLADETLGLQGANSSFLVTVLDRWGGLGVSLEQITFANNHTGGGVRVDSTHHVHIVDSNFINFATVGIWGSSMLGQGHELAVDRCRLTECTAKMSACADITKKKATAILLEFPDSHVRNTVITCGFAGIVNRAGSNTFITNHIWTSCTGDAPYGPNQTIGFADEAGATRISDCYFDNCNLKITGYRGTTVIGSFFNSGARLIFGESVDQGKCKINPNIDECMYWCGAVCGMVITSNRFLCGTAGCATINTTAYAIPAASDLSINSNSFEGVNTSVCLQNGKRSCTSVDDCRSLFGVCPP